MKVLRQVYLHNECLHDTYEENLKYESKIQLFVDNCEIPKGNTTLHRVTSFINAFT